MSKRSFKPKKTAKSLRLKALLAGGVMVSAYYTTSHSTAVGKPDAKRRYPGQSDDGTEGRLYDKTRVTASSKPTKTAQKKRRQKTSTNRAELDYDGDQATVSNKDTRKNNERKVSAKLVFDTTTPAFSTAKGGVSEGSIRVFGQKFEVTDGQIKTKINRDEDLSVKIKLKGENPDNKLKVDVKAVDKE
ncbi:MAG: hypothetical protein AAGK09_14155 [Planctomycetota bacterium]